MVIYKIVYFFIAKTNIYNGQYIVIGIIPKNIHGGWLSTTLLNRSILTIILFFWTTSCENLHQEITQIYVQIITMFVKYMRFIFASMHDICPLNKRGLLCQIFTSGIKILQRTDSFHFPNIQKHISALKRKNKVNKYAFRVYFYSLISVPRNYFIFRLYKTFTIK